MSVFKTLNFSELLIESKDLFVPPLGDIVLALHSELVKNFSQIDVKVVDCPDLTKPPYNLSSKGLNGCASIIGIGGPPYLLPLVNREKVYDVSQLPKVVGIDPAFIIGPGAGPWPYAGTNCEMIINYESRDSKITNLTRISKVVKNSDKPLLEKLPDSETRFCLLADLFCSNGQPGEVIEVHCKVRTGDKDFVTCLRLALEAKFGDKCVGMGGLFILANGKAKHHVMPDFSKTPIASDAALNDWLKFYEFSAPVVEVGVFVSKDPGLDMRLQHFHGYSDIAGGHYHYDTTPETVEYRAFLTPASTVYRIDKPQATHMIGRD